MILLVAVIAAFFISILVGGRPGRLACVRVQWAWLAPFAFAIQFPSIFRPKPIAEGLFSVQALAMILSYGLLLLFLWRNCHLFGVRLITAGLILNLLVMIANGGYMPITYQALQKSGHAHLALGNEPGSRVRNSKDVLLPLSETHLWWLSDIFVIPRPAPITAVFSFGDMMIALGAFRFLYKHMRQSPASPSKLHSSGRKGYVVGNLSGHRGHGVD